ncbi:hypothetical protein NDU88_005783 [Pleurodeles waltl]|uniref:Uncharacterized protein n=1 Tax=Pleurodeles waltl TaxID=8319 RepID=A0AAV7VK26_PLEWA|nr:hypothetical protein NDU88_005783 [Pleurodeles waltl]
MITIASRPYSIIKNRLNFKKFIMLEDDEGEGSKCTQEPIRSGATQQVAHWLLPVARNEEAKARPGSQ